MIYNFGGNNTENVRLEDVTLVEKSKDYNSGATQYKITLWLKNGSKTALQWKEEEHRDAHYDKIVTAMKSDSDKEGIKPMEYLKYYLKKHNDMIFTVFAVLLIDHFFLGGALRDRVKSLVEGLLTKVENSLKGDGDGTTKQS